jgi:chemotaxis protein MotB
MALLVSFFGMLVAFSTQDAKKMQVATGSMRDAFGVQKDANYSGIVESNGSKSRSKIKNVALIKPEDASVTPTPDMKGADFHHDRARHTAGDIAISELVCRRSEPRDST